MSKIKVVITDSQKSVKLPAGARLLIRKACTATLKTQKFEGDAEVSVTLVDDETIRGMNATYRNIDKSTDVLSFPLGSDGVYDINPENNAKMLGDIVISLEHALKQADLYGHSVEREVAYLTVHSMLHLLGYDHVKGGLQKEIMREKEEEVLELLGLAIIKD
ncbi:MAG: rRNA maturation RNase YbeY [Clostridiales bacterium]|nr:rRNA maturation RNase YbeY [Candidatus Equinaster intestinalis]